MMHGGNVWQGESPAAWLDFSANIRPEGAPQWVKSALTGAMDHVSYYPDISMRAAREGISAYLGVSPECVLPTAGGISAIDMAVQLDAEEILLCTPCFAEYALLAEKHGKRVRRLSLLREKHVLGELNRQVAPQQNCAVWLCNPMNPVGAAFPAEEVMELLARVEAARGFLVVDEAFGDYCPEHSVVKLVKTHERLLVTGSMTKSLGIPGVRLGYLCAQPHVLQTLSKGQLTWELNCFATAVASALPDHADEIRADARQNAKRRETLRKELVALGAFVYPSEASFLLADFGRPVENITALLKEKGILVRTCMNFDGIDDGCHLRIAVKDETANARLIAALREVLACAENA